MLITGCAGLIGCNLPPARLGQGHTITAYDTLSRLGNNTSKLDRELRRRTKLAVAEGFTQLWQSVHDNCGQFGARG